MKELFFRRFIAATLVSRLSALVTPFTRSQDSQTLTNLILDSEISKHEAKARAGQSLISMNVSVPLGTVSAALSAPTARGPTIDRCSGLRAPGLGGDRLRGRDSDHSAADTCCEITIESTN